MSCRLKFWISAWASRRLLMTERSYVRGVLWTYSLAIFPEAVESRVVGIGRKDEQIGQRCQVRLRGLKIGSLSNRIFIVIVWERDCIHISDVHGIDLDVCHLFQEGLHYHWNKMVEKRFEIGNGRRETRILPLRDGYKSSNIRYASLKISFMIKRQQDIFGPYKIND